MKHRTVIHDSAIEEFEQKMTDAQRGLAEHFVACLRKQMGRLNMSQSDVAYTLGKTRSYVSKLFTKEANLTIRSMVELAHSLGLDLSVQVWERPQSVFEPWLFPDKESFGKSSHGEIVISKHQMKSVAEGAEGAEDSLPFAV